MHVTVPTDHDHSHSINLCVLVTQITNTHFPFGFVPMYERIGTKANGRLNVVTGR